MQIYSEESAHATREAEKPHDVLSASWRPRGESGVELRPTVKAGQPGRLVA